MSRVDVIIPCYKYAHYLRGCVESVMTQSGVDVRALILDDASPDDTSQVAAELVREDARVEYRRHEVNQGHIRTYNEGLEWAGGDYVLLLSADDWLTSGALSRAARLMDAHPEVGLTCGGAYVVRPDRWEVRGVVPEKAEKWEVLGGLEFLERACQHSGNPVWTPTAVVRTSVQKALGGYRDDLPHTGDLEMWLRFSAHSSIGVINACQAHYRMHPGNMSASYCAHRVLDLKQRLEAFVIAIRNWKEPVPELGRFEGQLRRALAEVAFGEAQHAFDRGETGTCREFLAFAAATHADITRWPTWYRMRWKLLVGSRGWAALEWVRGRALGRRGRGSQGRLVRPDG